MTFVSENIIVMTSAHILYIPTIFLLGFLTGQLAGTGFRSNTNHPGISGKLLLGSFLIFAIVFAGTHFFEIPRSSKAVTKALNGLEIFDKKPSYTSDEVYLRIGSFPARGRALYKEFTYTIDILFPVTLFVFLILLARHSIIKGAVNKSLRVIIVLLPIIWISLDFTENAIIYTLLNNFPEKNVMLAGALGFITISKFSFLLFSILAPTILITIGNFSKRE